MSHGTIIVERRDAVSLVTLDRPHALFATNDQQEGMIAFTQKRPPISTGK